MEDSLTIRKKFISSVRRVVVKIGSNVLANSHLHLDEDIFSRLSEELSGLSQKGYKLVVVSSGAILAGMAKLGLKEKPHLIKQKQAVAAVGQSTLIRSYEKHFERFGKKVAQILLTDGEMAHRQRYINARNTIETLFCYEVIPIVNENDTVAIDEIKVGDNDTLSGVVSQMIEADLLIILSDIDGLFTADPTKDNKAGLIPLVEKIDQAIFNLASEASTCVGTGGMITKIKAAQAAARSGTATIIVNGKIPQIISRVLEGEDIGTLFLPKSDKLNSRKSWIAFTLKPRGTIFVDDGACKALMSDNRSLLASGIKSVKGEFEAGDAVSIISQDGLEFARGLVNYSAKEINRIKGIKSRHIEQILGYCTSDEIIHRDNLAILL